ncbi:MAG: putative hydro-lyase [Cellvibrionaceae bacterium]
MHFWSEQHVDNNEVNHSVAEVHQLRNKIRSGEFCQQTSGLVSGYVQTNIVILPSALAGDFLKFCVKNPKPCPLIAVSEPGEFQLKDLGPDIDIRTDVPKYLTYTNGQLTEELNDLHSVWQDDFVTFVLGCSFSFEAALLEANLPIRHIDNCTNVPMFKTNIDTNAAGVFNGKTVVTMRPFSAADAIKAVQITSRYRSVHGAPIHLGDPSLIGIDDLSQPDFGDKVEVKKGEIPVFWACGVTPQLAIEQAKIPFCITHKPGYMLITDLLNAQLSLI